MLTFTNKAARELKERLATLVGADVSKRIIVGTFHSVSLRYLQKYGLNIGLKKFAIADSSESRNLVSKIIKNLRKTGTTGSVQPEEDGGEKQLTAASALSYISTLKSQGITSRVFSTLANGRVCPISLSLAARSDLEIVFQEYQTHLEQHNLLDFDDLIINGTQLFKQYPSIVQNIEHVFVDEFQDTSAQQFDLMRLMSSSKSCVTIVGDHDQSIYGFRLADIANFKRMKKVFPECIEFHLKQNYRSSGAIVFAASALIEQDSSRPQKNLATENVLGPQPTLRELQNAKNEAAWISKEIKRLLYSSGSLIELQDVAILVRSASLTLPIEQALQRNQLKYRLQNARKFLERPHIRILVNYLKVVQSETTLSLLEIVNIPSRNFGQISIEKLQSESSRMHKNLWQTLKLVTRGSIPLSKKKDANMERRLCSLVRLIDSCRENVQSNAGLSMASLVTRLVNGLNYEKYLKQQYPEDFPERMDDVQEFMETSDVLAENSEEYELPTIDGINVATITETPLDRLMTALSLMSDTGNGSDEPNQVLTISTIHSAKGLEWPIVFIPGVYHGSIPSARAKDTEQDEERRLLYVAMTRAKALLYMSYPLKNARHESVLLSSFLSHSSMSHLLESRGPILNTHIVRDLALLMSRPQPAANAIVASEDSYNDLPVEQTAIDDYDLAFVNGKFLKRRTLEATDRVVGADAAFSTASDYLRLMSHEEPNKLDGQTPLPKALKSVSRAKTTGQKDIKSFFAPINVPKQLKSSQQATVTRSKGETEREEEDYRTVILSSSPEREFINVHQSSALASATTIGVHESIYTPKNAVKRPHPLTTTMYNTIVAKPRRTLGISRPRISSSRPFP